MSNRYRAWIITLAFAASLGLAPTAAPDDWSGLWAVRDGRQISADSLILAVAPDAQPEALIESIRTSGAQLRWIALKSGARIRPEILSVDESLPGSISHAVVTFDPATSPQDMMRRLSGRPGISGAWPNHIVHPSFAPNDPGYWEHQQNFRQIYADQAWDLGQGSGATVAVVDSGYLSSGLEDRVVNLDTGYDFRGNDSDTNDALGHGTHVSNTIAEATDNGVGMAGLAFQAKILVLKVFPDYDGGAYESDIIDAINYAVDEGAHVINMSLGGAGYNPLTNNTLDDAMDAGVIPVCASGNDGEPYVDYPGAYESCIAVGSVNMHATGTEASRSFFSNYGADLDLVAPGEGIVQESWSSGHGPGYFAAWGTSSAAPHVSGVLALLIGRTGVVEPDAVLQALYDTAQDIGGDGWDRYTGHGEVNAYQALVQYAGSVNNIPRARFSASPASGEAPLEVRFNADRSTDADGQIVSYEWDFGDGATASGVTANHTFDDAGEYLVKLWVTDDEGETDMADGIIEATVGGSGGGGGNQAPFNCNLFSGGGGAAFGLAALILVLSAPLILRRMLPVRSRIRRK